MKRFSFTYGCDRMEYKNLNWKVLQTIDYQIALEETINYFETLFRLHITLHLLYLTTNFLMAVRTFKHTHTHLKYSFI